MGPPTVVVADDHPASRAGIRTILEGDGFRVVGEAGDAQGAVALALRHQPSVCVLDVSMPGDGIAAAAEIRRRAPAVEVVILTVSATARDLIAALRAGASGYLLKSMNPDRLPAALRGVLAGEAAIPRELMRHVVEALRSRRGLAAVPDIPGVEISQREAEVMQMLSRGATTAEVAERLGLAQSTVRRHASAVAAKLGASDRRDALDRLAKAS